MRNLRTIAAFSILLLLVVAPMGATADESNKKSVVTFSGQVALPGMTLEPGTYVFKLDENERGNRNIIQVWNQDESKQLGTFLGVREYRLKPSGADPIIKFDEEGSKAIEAVRAWFYPGDNYGLAFVYPKSEAMELAKANNQKVPAIASMPTGNDPKQLMEAEVHSIDSSGKETRWQDQADQSATGQSTMDRTDRDQMTAQQRTDTQQQTTDTQQRDVIQQSRSDTSTYDPDTLPRTASNLPLFGLIGLLALGAALVLSLAVRGLSS